jgi:alpha-mannosidase
MKHLLVLVLLLAVVLPVSAATFESFALREDGSVPLWTVAGPLPNAAVHDHGASCVGFYTDYLEAARGETAAMPSEGDSIGFGDETVAWRTVFSTSSGLLDYNRIFDITKDVPSVAYAFCIVTSEKEQNVRLKIRSNDGVRVWLNADLAHDNHVGRVLSASEDTVPVTLKKGENRLLVKVDQSGGGWGLQLRVVDSDGTVAAGIYTDKPLARGIVEASFSGTPLVRKTPGGERQIILANITSGLVEGLTCTIENEDWPAPHVVEMGNLPAGEHRIEIDVPVMETGRLVQVTLQTADAKLELPDMALPKPRKWMINLVQHVHTDIGYTRPQTEILPEHLRYIDYALDYCDLTDDYPDASKFRWTCEITWAVEEYIKRRPAEQIARLKRRVAEGRIEIAGMFLNMSEIATESSLASSLLPIRTIREELDAPVQVAMQNDVNGAGWCLVDYFEPIGVKYLMMGINRTRSILPFDQPTPFWWESPSGRRMLAYRADHYHTGNFWGIHTGNLPNFETGLVSYLERLDKLGYPFDIASVQYSGYHTDNSPPAMKECDLIRAWNAKYAWPKLRSATASEFLKEIEENHGDELPVHRQSWPDWWTDGFGSAARETAATRKTHVAMQTNEALLSMAALFGAQLSPDVSDRIRAVQDNLLFYDEHTFGAAESISDPLAENSMVQWGEKGSYVWEAVKKAGLIREEALGALQPYLPRVDVPTIAIFNTLNWERSGLVEVFIDDEILPRGSGFRIVDPEDGAAIAAQAMRSRSEGTYWALWVSNVPPLGYKSYRIELADEGNVIAAAPDAGPGILENEFFRLNFDPETGGIVRLLDKRTMRQMVDEKAAWGLGQMLRETIPDRGALSQETVERTGLSEVKLLLGGNGPIWKSILIEGEMVGCQKGRGVRVEVRLYKTEPRIEFHFAVRKLPITAPEAIYVAFPFSFPDGEILYEGQGGIVRPGKDQLPGSASDWQTLQNFAVVRGGDSQLIFGSDAVPLVQLGDMNLGKWQPVTDIKQPHIYSWVMNNYWFTNFRATQEGEFKFSYYLTATENTSNTEATRFGWGSRIHMVPRVLPPGNAEASAVASTLDLGAPNIILVDARPAYYGEGIVLHLRELDGKATDLPLADLLAKATLQEINVLEEVIEKGINTVTFKPYDSRFLKLSLK